MATRRAPMRRQRPHGVLSKSSRAFGGTTRRRPLEEQCLAVSDGLQDAACVAHSPLEPAVFGAEYQGLRHQHFADPEISPPSPPHTHNKNNGGEGGPAFPRYAFSTMPPVVSARILVYRWMTKQVDAYGAPRRWSLPCGMSRARTFVRRRIAWCTPHCWGTRCPASSHVYTAPCTERRAPA